MQLLGTLQPILLGLAGVMLYRKLISFRNKSLSNIRPPIVNRIAGRESDPSGARDLVKVRSVSIGSILHLRHLMLTCCGRMINDYMGKTIL